MNENNPTDPMAPLQNEREKLIEETTRFERLLEDPQLSAEEIQVSIEELRAIRRRLHEIDLRAMGKECD